MTVALDYNKADATSSPAKAQALLDKLDLSRYEPDLKQILASIEPK